MLIIQMGSLQIVIPPMDHQIFTHEAPDGTLRAWDVTLGMEIAATNHHILTFSLIEHAVTVEKVHSLYEGIDEHYAMTTNLRRPLLFVPLLDEVLLIDGHHRLLKAAHLGVAELPMILLTQAEADAIQWLELPPERRPFGL